MKQLTFAIVHFCEVRHENVQDIAKVRHKNVQDIAKVRHKNVFLYIAQNHPQYVIRTSLAPYQKGEIVIDIPLYALIADIGG